MFLFSKKVTSKNHFSIRILYITMLFRVRQPFRLNNQYNAIIIAVVHEKNRQIGVHDVWQ